MAGTGGSFVASLGSNHFMPVEPPWPWLRPSEMSLDIDKCSPLNGGQSCPQDDYWFRGRLVHRLPHRAGDTTESFPGFLIPVRESHCQGGCLWMWGFPSGPLEACRFLPFTWGLYVSCPSTRFGDAGCTPANSADASNPSTSEGNPSNIPVYWLWQSINHKSFSQALFPSGSRSTALPEVCSCSHSDFLWR